MSTSDDAIDVAVLFCDKSGPTWYIEYWREASFTQNLHTCPADVCQILILGTAVIDSRCGGKVTKSEGLYIFSLFVFRTIDCRFIVCHRHLHYLDDFSTYPIAGEYKRLQNCK